MGIEMVITSLQTENLPVHLEYYDEVLILVLDRKKEKEVKKSIKSLDKDDRKRVQIDYFKNYFISMK